MKTIARQVERDKSECTYLQLERRVRENTFNGRTTMDWSDQKARMFFPIRKSGTASDQHGASDCPVKVES